MRSICLPFFTLLNTAIMPVESSVQTLRAALNSLQSGDSTVAAFCLQWRAATALLAALPARYGQVMEDLLAHPALWLDKAEQTLQLSK